MCRVCTLDTQQTQKTSLNFTVFIGFHAIIHLNSIRRKHLIKKFLLQKPTNYFDATSNSVFSVLPHFCLDPPAKKPIYQSEYLVCVYHYLYEKALTFALRDSKSVVLRSNWTKKCQRHEKFAAVMLIFSAPIQLCKTNPPHPPRHSEIILFALIHQQRKSSKLQSQWLFIPPCDNPDPSKANICLVFGVADGQLGIRKQQLPWSDVNLARHVDFINHPVSSVNLIGR